ncbi:MAG: metal-dependent hydrolase [Methanoregulaceae archaeon]
MITRHHLMLAGLGTGILGLILIPRDPAGILFLVLAACLGAILPDFHMKKPRTAKIRIPAWYIAQFTLRFLLPVINRVYRLIRKNTNTLDKKMTHSFIGIFLIFWILTFITAGISTGLILLSGATEILHISGLFLLGLFTGLVLHLFADLCTKKGIAPFYPVSTICVSGSIRPCDTSDPRIRRYIICNVVIILLLLTARYAGAGSSSVFILGLLGFLLCQGMMVAQSDLTLSENKAGAGKYPITG